MAVTATLERFKKVYPAMQCICFTGPRPKNLCGYTSIPGVEPDIHEKYASMVEAVKDVAITEAMALNAHRKAAVFISGGAQGFDQLAFWAVHKAKAACNILNVVFVPFAGQEGRWADTGIFSKKEYNQMLNCADILVYLHGPLTDNNQAARLLMFRNHAMVDASTLCISGLKDNDIEGRGGTKECMRYARSKHVAIKKLNYEITKAGICMKHDITYM